MDGILWLTSEVLRFVEGDLWYSEARWHCTGKSDYVEDFVRVLRGLFGNSMMAHRSSLIVCANLYD